MKIDWFIYFYLFKWNVSRKTNRFSYSCTRDTDNFFFLKSVNNNFNSISSLGNLWLVSARYDLLCYEITGKYDGRYEIDVERRIAGNSVNRSLAALMRWRNIWPYTMQSWYRGCYPAAKRQRNVAKKKNEKRWVVRRCDLFVGYAKSAWLSEE